MHTKGFLLRVIFFSCRILFIFAFASAAVRVCVAYVYLSKAHVFVFVTLWHLVVTHTYIHSDLCMSVCTYFLLAHSCAHFFCFICYTIYTHLIRRVELRKLSIQSN